MSIELTKLQREEFSAIAVLLHQSLVQWYESRLGQGNRFGTDAEPFSIFPEAYECLDPGEAIVARDAESKKILGVCFVHPRETHYGIGIVATSPSAAGRGVARLMMQEAIRRATDDNKPLRLVSSLLNLDSFSLYTKLGFVPRTVFQDLLITAPETGIPYDAQHTSNRIRVATQEDAARLADFELSLQGIRRQQDYEFFLENKVGQWKVWMSENAEGQVNGVLVASLNPAMPMLGPGVVADEETAIRLIATALNSLSRQSYVILVPARAEDVIKTLYSWGAKNIELHIAQAFGDTPEGNGISFPTFLPESG